MPSTRWYLEHLKLKMGIRNAHMILHVPTYTRKRKTKLDITYLGLSYQSRLAVTEWGKLKT